MNDPAITSFTGEHRFLSNFWPAPVLLDGVEYPTVEHAYQAAKTLDAQQRNLVRGIPHPRYAKSWGKWVTIRSDWHEVRVSVMADLLAQKFARSTPLAQMLDATGTATLQEGNAWGDTFWGVCDGIGENHLGRLLMQIRAENRMHSE